MSVFIFDSHGAQEHPAAWTIVRNGALVQLFMEKREARGEPAAVVHLGDDALVSLVRPSAELQHDPQAYPRYAGRAPGVYVRIHAVTYAFSADRYPGVGFRLLENDAFLEVFTADRMVISNHLDLDADQVPGELLLAVARFGPGVIVGDGSKGALAALAGDAAQQRV